MFRKFLFAFLTAILLAACSPSRTSTPAAVSIQPTASAVPTNTEPPATAVPTVSSMTLTDDLGRTITMASPAKRVVSLARLPYRMSYAARRLE